MIGERERRYRNPCVLQSYKGRGDEPSQRSLCGSTPLNPVFGCCPLLVLPLFSCCCLAALANPVSAFHFSIALSEYVFEWQHSDVALYYVWIFSWHISDRCCTCDPANQELLFSNISCLHAIPNTDVTTSFGIQGVDAKHWNCLGSMLAYVLYIIVVRQACKKITAQNMDPWICFWAERNLQSWKAFGPLLLGRNDKTNLRLSFLTSRLTAGRMDSPVSRKIEEPND